MLGTWIDVAGHTELLDIPQTLYLGRVHDGYCLWAEVHVMVDSIVQVLRSKGMELCSQNFKHARLHPEGYQQVKHRQASGRRSVLGVKQHNIMRV